MSVISALTSQPTSQSSSNSFDAQIKVLEKKIDKGVKDGTITQAQADEINKVLDSVKQAIGDAGNEASLSPTDKTDIRQLLRDIAQAAAGGPRAINPQAASGGADNDGDNDGSGFNATV